MKETTLTRYGNLLLVEDGEEPLSGRDVNKIEREKQKCIIQVEREHVFADGEVGCLCRATFFDMFPDLAQYEREITVVNALIAHYHVERKATYVDFKNKSLPSQIIKGSACVLGAHVANAFLELSHEGQKNRALYATRVWGKSGLGEISFMQSFWEVFALRARGMK